LNVYPKYEKSTEVKGKKFTVHVWAKTQCGPIIRAKSTVDIRKDDTLAKLERNITPIAVRNLSYEYEPIEATCIAKGKHGEHR
jgi:folate-dependent phosphoribosylglycinamide formyltransferase PurN